MERSRIYVDTSVLGGCFDSEFAVWSNGLIAVNVGLGHKALTILSPREVTIYEGH
jgi:hypothetical protein